MDNYISLEGLTSFKEELDNHFVNIDELTLVESTLENLGTEVEQVQTDLSNKSNSDHTHNYAGSSSAGGAATSANKVNQSFILKVNSGTQEGNNIYTFNGSANKTINLKAGTNISLETASNTITVNSTSPEYTTATTTSLGLVKIGYTESGRNYPVELNDSGQMFVNVPWTDNSKVYTSGTGIDITNSVIKNTGVIDVTEGSSNGSIAVITASGSTDIQIPGLGSAAYTESSAYATSTHTHDLATTSTNGFMSSTDKSKLNGIESGAQVNKVTSVAGRTGAITLSKSDVGLSNVDNTSDVNKPISNATQAALDDKADSVDLTSHTSNTSNPHNVTKAQVGLGNVTNESKATMFTSPTFTGTPKAPTPSANNNSTQIATTAYVDTAISNHISSVTGMMSIKGVVNSTTNLPTSGYKAGWSYIVETAGTYAGMSCKAGDIIVCVSDFSTSFKNSDWTVIKSNMDGVVTGPTSAVDAHVAIFSGSTGTLIKDSGFTIAKSVPADAVFTDTTYTLSSFGITATSTELNYCDGVTSNIQTQLNGKALSSHNHDSVYAKISHGNHVPTTGTADNATYLRNDNTWHKIVPSDIGAATSSHTHNYAASSSAGGAATTAVALTTSAGSATQPVYFSSGKPVACTYTLSKSVPSNAVFTDTHYTTYLYACGSDGTANEVTSNGYTYLRLFDNTTARSSLKITGSGATTVTSDASGVITIKSTDTNTTYGAATASTAGLMSAADKTKLDGIATGANAYSLPTATSSTLGGVKIGSGVSISSGAISVSLSNLGVKATAAELNVLDGITATVTELNYCDGVTSNIQTQLNSKLSSSTTVTNVAQSNSTSNANYPILLSATATSTSSRTGAAIFDDGVYVNPSTSTIKATTFSGSLSGNASTATTLQNSRTINGTSFNGSANITTTNWGTARNITIGNTTRSVNGSTTYSWSLSDIGAASSSHTHSTYLPLSGGTLTGTLNTRALAGSWINGKTTVAIAFDSLKAITSGSYHPFFGMKSNSGNVINFGGLGNNIGFYGFYKATTENQSDFSFVCDTTTGNWTCNKKITASGGFSGSLSGNASTATTLQTSRTINGTNFNGSANITTSNWGTARTLTIGNTGKSVNGSANVSWTLSDIGAAASSHTHTSLASLTITNTTASTSTGTGALIVKGGVGVAGNIYATGFYASSSLKYKENISDYTDSALSILDKVKIVNFNYKNDENKIPKVGFIAEETPSLLSTPDMDREDIYNCIGLLIKAVQELKEENRKLRELIEK